MAENLREEISGAICYDDNPENCEIYGFMYDWETANKVCPIGWHLPSENEWDTLRNIDNDNEGTKLKANSSLWISGAGTDYYNFTALPGGYYSSSFKNIGKIAAFWSTTKWSASTGYLVHFLTYSYAGSSYLILSTNKAFAYVRCIKD